jgi:hypothetical protein
MTCPVCKSDLFEEYRSSSDYGVEESKYECTECGLYSEAFAYGTTEIFIGDFVTGYTYKTDPQVKMRIAEIIVQLGKLYSK